MRFQKIFFFPKKMELEVSKTKFKIVPGNIILDCGILFVLKNNQIRHADEEAEANATESRS